MYGMVSPHMNNLRFAVKGPPQELSSSLNRIAIEYGRHFPNLQGLTRSQVLRFGDASQESASMYVDLSHTLEKIKPGAKYWFAFSFQAKEYQSQLILIDISTDPNQKKFNALSQGLDNRAPILYGKARIDDKKRLNFRSTKRMDHFLETLAKWAIQNKESCPNLHHLYDARHICKDQNGQTLSRTRNEQLWEGLL